MRWTCVSGSVCGWANVSGPTKWGGLTCVSLYVDGRA